MITREKFEEKIIELGGFVYKDGKAWTHEDSKFTFRYNVFYNAVILEVDGYNPIRIAWIDRVRELKQIFKHVKAIEKLGGLQ